ncbi:hypothetical protein Tco_0784185 [Tanacetum coccineum]
MQTYWASVVMLPKATVKEINRVLKSFLWNKGKDIKGKEKLPGLWSVVLRLKVNKVKLKGKSFWEINVEQSDSGTWKFLIDLRRKVRQYIIHEIGDGKGTSMCRWKWPQEWYSDFPILAIVQVPSLNISEDDVIKWKTKKGQKVCFSTKKAWLDIKEDLPKYEYSAKIWDGLKGKIKADNIPNDWDKIIQYLANLPSNNSIWSIVNKIILANAIYHIWKERNGRIFTSDAKSSDIVLQTINEHVRLQIMSLKPKVVQPVMRVSRSMGLNVISSMVVIEMVGPMTEDVASYE